MTDYKRDIATLESVAVKWWPTTLLQRESDASVIPILLKTLEQFLSILKLSGDRPDQFFGVLEQSSLPENVFLKHLCVLANFGGEPLMRVNRNIEVLFRPKGRNSKHRCFDYVWREQIVEYCFQGLPMKSLSNSKLHIDGKSLLVSHKMGPAARDVATLLMHGAAATDEKLSEETLAGCEIGTLLGRPDELEQYVREKYITVSRITEGAKANSLGQIAQNFVKGFLKERLRPFEVRGGAIKLPNGDAQVFDVVVENGEKAVGVEVSFQVTTNSTIERKAKQAELRYKTLRKFGYHVAYVIDGAGNFERRNAISNICRNSDCTVAYSEAELKVLVEFIKSVLK